MTWQNRFDAKSFLKHEIPNECQTLDWKEWIIWRDKKKSIHLRFGDITGNYNIEAREKYSIIFQHILYCLEKKRTWKNCGGKRNFIIALCILYTDLVKNLAECLTDDVQIWFSVSVCYVDLLQLWKRPALTSSK